MKQIGALLGALLCTWALACSAKPPPYRAAEVPHGRLFQRGPLWILELSGTPSERGAATGELTGPQLRWALSQYLKAVHAPTTIDQATRRQLQQVRSHLLPAHSDQLTALARSAGVDPDLLLLINLAPETFSAGACSWVATGTTAPANAAPWVARNLDWYGGEVLSRLSLVIVEQGTEHSLISFSWPGLVGVVTGINDAGLTVANLVVLNSAETAQPGMPVLFALRAMLEQHATVAQAAQWLAQAPRTVPQNYGLADPTTRLVLETAAQRFKARSAPADRGLVVTNLFNEDQHPQPGSRFATLDRVASHGPVGVAQLEAGLNQVALGAMNVQAILLNPTTRRARLAVGTPPVASHTFVELDLSGWLAPVTGVTDPPEDDPRQKTREKTPGARTSTPSPNE